MTVMTSEPLPLETLLSQIHEQEEDWDAQQKAVQTLRQAALNLRDIRWLTDCIENKNAPVATRISAVHLLGYHRPWHNLEFIHDDQVHEIPARLVARAKDADEERALRDAVISAVGWQYLSEYETWDTLLTDPDAFLRREALYELLRAPQRNRVEQIIRHLHIEPEPSVRAAVAWGVCRHAQFFDVALSMLTRPGGAQYLDTVYEACETDLPGSARALLAADMKFFEVRETLLRRLFHPIDHTRIVCLIDLMQDVPNRFAVRMLQEVDADRAGEVLALLDRTVIQRDDEAWTHEAARLALHYWERFSHLREHVRDLLNAWRQRCPRITRLAMEKNIYWRE